MILHCAMIQNTGHNLLVQWKEWFHKSPRNTSSNLFSFAAFKALLSLIKFTLFFALLFTIASLLSNVWFIIPYRTENQKNHLSFSSWGLNAGLSSQTEEQTLWFLLASTASRWCSDLKLSMCNTKKVLFLLHMFLCVWLEIAKTRIDTKETRELKCACTALNSSFPTHILKQCQRDFPESSLSPRAQMENMS